MTDDLEGRLRAADPIASTHSPPTSSWISDLVEETMNEKTTADRRRWQVPAVAAAVLVLGIGGYAVVQSQDAGHSGTAASAKPMVLKTTASAGGIGHSLCIQFTPSLLAQKQVAFSGTVTQTTKTSALLNVDHWYRGGSTAQVKISVPDGSHVVVEGGITFSEGQRYLVTADHGVVSGCGYTAPWSASMAAAFKTAFS